MITRLSHVTVFVKNQDEALRFYLETLGFEKRMDATFQGFRWVTVAPPNQKEVELVLLEPKAVFDPAVAAKIEELMAAGKLGGCVFNSDDCQGDYERLKSKGVEFKGPPEKKPFGLQATFRDNSNTWFSLTQTR
jgi:catechol 2,3-dioxygenase-like lactoylglutathione lyase family enzyme